MGSINTAMTCLELCAGAGGQALGLEAAGFTPLALVDVDPHCVNTLKANRPHWNVIEHDLATFDARPYSGIDLVAGGLPCPPFSKAGRQLGESDDRDMFPHAIKIIRTVRPKAILIENVRGFLDSLFDGYRQRLRRKLKAMGYETDWRLMNASDYGVPQLRPRVAIVAMQTEYWPYFAWPEQSEIPPQTVGNILRDLMEENGWRGAQPWAEQANSIAPTIVGGSKKHGGPDLGPTRAKRAWADLGVDGMGIADAAPSVDFDGNPKLTVRMVARLQGFPDTWHFTGRKTAAYRQIGNAFPPPVAAAIASQIRAAILSFEGSSRRTA